MTAIVAQGTTLAYNTGPAATPAFSPIPGISEISGFNGAANVIDTTDLNSKAKEKKLGLQDWGQLSLSLHTDLKQVAHSALLAAKKTGSVMAFLMTLSDGTTIAFSAFVKDFPIAAKVDQIVTGSINLEITGDITVTPGTSS